MSRCRGAEIRKNGVCEAIYILKKSKLKINLYSMSSYLKYNLTIM